MHELVYRIRPLSGAPCTTAPKGRWHNASKERREGRTRTHRTERKCGNLCRDQVRIIEKVEAVPLKTESNIIENSSTCRDSLKSIP